LKFLQIKALVFISPLPLYNKKTVAIFKKMPPLMLLHPFPSHQTHWPMAEWAALGKIITALIFLENSLQTTGRLLQSPSSLLQSASRLLQSIRRLTQSTPRLTQIRS